MGISLATGQEGYSLIELMVSMLIIALLASLALLIQGEMRIKAYQAEMRSFHHSLHVAFGARDAELEYPTTNCNDYALPCNTAIKAFGVTVANTGTPRYTVDRILPGLANFIPSHFNINVRDLACAPGSGLCPKERLWVMDCRTGWGLFEYRYEDGTRVRYEHYDVARKTC